MVCHQAGVVTHPVHVTSNPLKGHSQGLSGFVAGIIVILKVMSPETPLSVSQSLSPRITSIVWSESTVRFGRSPAPVRFSLRLGGTGGGGLEQEEEQEDEEEKEGGRRRRRRR